MVITGNRALVDDAVQAAWVTAWRRLGSLRDADRLRPWLMSVAANEARQLIRSIGRRADYERAAASAQASHGPGGDPAAAADRVDLVQAVRQLSPDERRLVALRFVADLTSEQIARELGGSASAVRGKLARIVARLRRELDR